MHRLASGERDGAIPGLDRPDELGTMAKSVQVFKDNMIETDRLRTEQEAQKQGAARERRQAMLDLATKFEASVGGIVESVASAASGLQSAAQTIAATSAETTRQSTRVTDASEQASRNVQTVASAAEELSASIREIGQQVNQAGVIIQEGVRQTNRVERTGERTDQHGGEDRRCGADHQRYRRTDQPAGAECHD